MSSPQLGVDLRRMSFRGLIFWGILGALGVAGLANVAVREAPVTTLEQTLGADVEISRL